MPKASPVDPKTPERYRTPLVYTEDNALDPKFGGRLSDWIAQNTDRFVRGGNVHGRHNFEIVGFDRVWPDATEVAGHLLNNLDEYCERLLVPRFDPTGVEINLTLYHHGSHFGWHDDSRLPDGAAVAGTRRITFAYYMHRAPRMFEGGELEFMDGTKVGPVNNRLAVFHPFQRHRIRRVECWAPEALCGRFALMGWIHGAETGDWVELAERLCPR